MFAETGKTFHRSVAACVAVFLLSAACFAQARIASVSPAFGPPGTKVTLRGQGLLNPDPDDTRTPWFQGISQERPPGRVEFNGAPAVITLWQDDLIAVVVPQGANDGPIRVIVDRLGVIAEWGPFDVYYDAKPSALDRPPLPREVPGEARPRSQESDQRGAEKPDSEISPRSGRDVPSADSGSSRIGPLERGMIQEFLTQGIEAFLRGEFRRVEEYLSRYLQGTGAEKGRAYFYRGAARCGIYYLSGGKDEALLNSAVEDFRMTLKLKPTFQPPRDIISPKILRLFDQVR